MNQTAIDPVALADSLVTKGGPPTSNAAGSPSFRTCSVCGGSFPATDAHFYAVHTRKNRLTKKCRACITAETAAWRRTNPEKNKSCDRWAAVKNDPSRHQAHLERKRANWKQATIEQRLKSRLRGRLYRALLRNSKLSSAIQDLGCTIPQFRSWLEQQFLPGMSWENYGRGPRCWNIDHIIPFEWVDFSNKTALLKAVHYTNMRPLWSTENLTRTAGNNLDEELSALGLLFHGGLFIFPIDLRQNTFNQEKP